MLVGYAPVEFFSKLLAAERAKLVPLLAKRDAVQERLDSLKEQRESKKATAAATSDKEVRANLLLAASRLDPEIGLCEADLKITPKPTDEVAKTGRARKTTADLVAEQEAVVQKRHDKIVIAARKVEYDRLETIFEPLRASMSAIVQQALTVLTDLRQTNASLNAINACHIEIRDFPGWDFALTQILHQAFHANTDEQKMKAANAATEAAKPNAA